MALSKEIKSGIILGILFGVFFITVVGIKYTVSRISCINRFPNFEKRYNLFAGCMVEKDGIWLPDENIRFID